MNNLSSCEKKDINIRAGLLYNLCISDYKKINNYVIQDILYMNGHLNRVIEYSYFYTILQLFEPGEDAETKSPKVNLRNRLCRRNSINKNMEDLLVEVKHDEVFPKYSSEIIPRFKEIGFTDSEINVMLRSFLDLKELCAKSYMIIVNNWKYNPDKTGLDHEKKALINLQEIGFKISEGKHGNIPIEYNGITINLNGRPDGVIEYSPGNVYPAGTLIEIKTKPMNSARPNVFRDEMQLCAYGIIFDADVLYVVINNYNYMTCKLYRKAELRQIWENKKDIILGNTLILKQYMDNFTANTENANTLISLAIGNISNRN